MQKQTRHRDADDQQHTQTCAYATGGMHQYNHAGDVKQRVKYDLCFQPRFLLDDAVEEYQTDCQINDRCTDEYFSMRKSTGDQLLQPAIQIDCDKE